MLSAEEKITREGITFDDVLLLPAQSESLPSDVSTVAQFSRRIPLEIPLVSAAMDTVTESGLAIALAREGGLGVIHKNLSVADQVLEVDKVSMFGLSSDNNRFFAYGRRGVVGIGDERFTLKQWRKMAGQDRRSVMGDRQDRTAPGRTGD